MKKSILLLIALISATVPKAVADIYTVSSQEQTKMLNESDDWIDEMPDGLQDKLSDAVTHSLRGFFNELSYFRGLGVEDSTGYPSVSSRWLMVKDSDVKIRLYKDARKTSKTLFVYFHGGGWSLGSVKMVDKFCRAIAANTNIAVAAVEYPQAPENDYVEIITKSASAVRYLHSQYGKAMPISIGGDGAGGNLALASFYLLRHTKPDLKINSLVLYYPLLSVHPDNTRDEWRSYSRGYGLDGRVMEAFSRVYNAPVAITDNYVTTAAELSDSEIKALPPVLIVMSGRDIVIGEGRSFAKRLKDLGIRVRPVEFEGAIHGFITDGKQSTAFNKTIEMTRTFLSPAK